MRRGPTEALADCAVPRSAQRKTTSQNGPAQHIARARNRRCNAPRATLRAAPESSGGACARAGLRFRAVSAHRWYSHCVLDAVAHARTPAYLPTYGGLSHRWPECAPTHYSTIRRSAVYGVGNCFEQRQMYGKAIEAFKRALKCACLGIYSRSDSPWVDSAL